MTTDKLKEEILKKYIATIVSTGYDDFYRKSIVLEAMQAYHEQKMKEEAPEDFNALMTHDKEVIARWYLDLVKQLRFTSLGERGDVVEILWQHATNMDKDETEAYIPWTESESITNMLLQSFKAKLKGEIINAIDWLDHNYDHELAGMSRTEQIDEYLKTRTK